MGHTQLMRHCHAPGMDSMILFLPLLLEIKVQMTNNRAAAIVVIHKLLPGMSFPEVFRRMTTVKNSIGSQAHPVG